MQPLTELARLIRTVTWRKGQPIHRIHLDAYAADAFNPGTAGNARFSPIRNAAGASVPTLYGGTSFDCAAMETVFHDVPFAAGLKTFDKAKLIGQLYSTLSPRRALALADLSATALRALGLRRIDLIDTEKDQYPATRLWAEAIHAARPDVQGLRWVSRQDDRAKALVLFGDRLPASDLVVSGATRAILADVALYGSLLALAERIGLNVVDSGYRVHSS